MTSFNTETDSGQKQGWAAHGSRGQHRQDFLDLVAHLRPALHKYCTRMTGSIADGEDVVQDTLARAYFELSEYPELPPLRPWLFRIAHNRAIDVYRRALYRETEQLDEHPELPDLQAVHPEQIVSNSQAIRGAFSVFLALPPLQRACVILVDVLEFSLNETRSQLGLSLPATKAALHRGRIALKKFQSEIPATVVQAAPPPSPALQQYVSLFNSHDWDGVRNMLAEDVRLDLVSRRQASGSANVANYFTNYDRTLGWRLAAGHLDGCEVAAVFTTANGDQPTYFVAIEFSGERVVLIRDYRHVEYLAQDLDLALTLARLP
jgi:RNA polymerase sigma factor (sigma-70 family)